MASLTGNLVAETYKALLKTIDNDILTASEKQITDGLGGGSNVFIDSQGFLRANKYKVTNGLATQFLKADGSLDSNAYLTSITGAQVITALGFTPVTNQRTLTINGVTYNLTADRSWTVEGTAAVWGNITGTLSNQTDLQNALNAKYNNPTGTISQYIRGDGSIANFPAVTGFVPYTGATANVDLGEYALSAEYLAIDTDTTHVTDVGEIVWNPIDGTFDMGLLNGVVLQAGQELHFYGKASGAIGNGQAVMFAGVEGDHLLMSLADAATINANPQYFIGIATQDFANNDFGYVTVLGKVRGLNTTSYSLGDVLYYNSTSATDGSLTTTMPVAPNAKIEVAAVVRVHATQGILMVRPHIMPKLNQVQDVYIADPANNHGLFYDLANGYWRNTSIATALGYTPQAQLNGTGFVKASGTTISYDNSTYLTTANAASTYLALTGGTLTGSITATSFVKTGGTSTQYLKADGSVAEITGDIISGAGSAGYVPKWTSAIVLGSSLLYDNGTSMSIGTLTLNYGGYGRTLTGSGFAATSFGFEAVTGSTTNGGLIGGLSLVIANNDASRRIGSQIQSYISGATATNQGADLRFYVKPDAGVLLEIVRMTSAGITFNKDLTATNITATAFIKSGGTSSQFLMADGSVSTLSSPVTGSGSAGYIPKWTTAANIGSSIIYEDVSIGIAYTTPNKGGYGRTLTGAAFGSASFGFEAVSNTTTNGGLIGGLSFIVNQNDSSRIVGSTIQSNLVGTTATNYGADLRFFAKADAISTIAEVARMTSAGLRVYGTIIKDGGTSSQYLMADGSVSTFSGVSGSGTTNYLAKWTSGSAIGNSLISDNGSNLIFNPDNLAGKYINVNQATGADGGFLFTRQGVNKWQQSIINTDADALSFYSYAAVSVTMQLRSNGNVLIGSQTDAGYKLDVNGTARIQNNLIANGNLIGSQFNVATIVGASYGTTTLSNNQSVTAGAVIGTYGGLYAFIDLATQASVGSWIDFSKGDGSDFAGRIRYSNVNDRFDFHTAGGGAKLSIASTGNVLINTETDSGFKLDVNGGARFQSGLTSTSGSFSSDVSISGNLTLNTGADRFIQIGSSSNYYWRLKAAGDDFEIRMANDFAALKFYYPTGAATFVNNVTANTFTSNLTSGIFFNNSSGGTNATQLRINNTSGDLRMGIESSVGQTIQLGTLAYAAVLGNQANNPLQFTTNGTTRLTILGNGNVGIGTSSASSILTITPPASTSASTIEFTSTDNAAITSYYSMTFAVDNSNSVGGRRIVFAKGAKGYGNQVRSIMELLGDNGNVLIGTSTDSGGRLQVDGGSIRFNWANPSTSNYIWINRNAAQDGGLLFTSNNSLDWQVNNTGGNFAFYSYGTSNNVLYLSRSTGQLIQGGGAARSTYGTTIAFTGNSQSIWSANTDCGDGGRFFSIVNENTTVNAFSAVSFRVNPGSGGSSGNAMLDMKFVNNGSSTSTLVWSFLTSGGFFDRMTLSNSGNLTATAFFESSDIRLKTLIESNPIIEGIEKLEAKLYAKNGKIELGYFAQEAEKIMPYAISKGMDGFLNLSYREIHTAKIARLEQRVAELEKQLNLN